MTRGVSSRSGTVNIRSDTQGLPTLHHDLTLPSGQLVQIELLVLEA